MLELAEHRAPTKAKKLKRERAVAKKMRRLNEIFAGLLSDSSLLL